MKKNLLLGILFLLPFQAAAQTGDIPSEAEQMGIAAGIAMRCRAAKELYKFEEIVSRYFANTAPNQKLEEELLSAYLRAKARSYINSARQNVNCAADLQGFAKMPIMNFELYSDGSLKTTDGRWLYPRGKKAKAADAVRVY